MDVQAAVDESNSEKLLEHVHRCGDRNLQPEARACQGYKPASSHHAEGEALNQALETRRLSKHDRLGFSG